MLVAAAVLSNPPLGNGGEAESFHGIDLIISISMQLMYHNVMKLIQNWGSINHQSLLKA